MKSRAIIAAAAFIGIFTVFPDCEAIESGNIVGYVSTPVKQGENVLGLPPKVGGGRHTLGEIATTLEDGDLVQYGDEYDKRWAEICECEDGRRHAFSEDDNSLVDDVEVPSMGDRQILSVRRKCDNSNPITLSGEFESGNPLNIVGYVSGPAPLNKLKLNKSLVDSLTVPKTITITNKVHVPFPTVIAKQFDIVMKDGNRLRVKVDPRTQVIVDAQTEKPIGVSSGDIARFEEVSKDADVPQEERASKSDMSNVAAEVRAKSSDYHLIQTLREAVIGSLWDSKDVPGSLIRWGIVTLVVSFISKLGDIAWGWFFNLISRLLCLVGRKSRFTIRWLFRRKAPILKDNIPRGRIIGKRGH